MPSATMQTPMTTVASNVSPKMRKETAAAATILSNETAELDQLAARFQVAPQPSPRPQQAARATGQRQPSEALA